jgi:hypothetical protein
VSKTFGMDVSIGINDGLLKTKIMVLRLCNASFLLNRKKELALSYGIFSDEVRIHLKEGKWQEVNIQKQRPAWYLRVTPGKLNY